MFKRWLKFFANKNENVDPIVKEKIDKNAPTYPNIKVANRITGDPRPIKVIQTIEKIKYPVINIIRFALT